MLLQALKKKLEGDVAVAKANVLIYKQKSVGIGEHPEIVQAIEMKTNKEESIPPLSFNEALKSLFKRHMFLFEALKKP